jgi:hypothetical protein
MHQKRPSVKKLLAYDKEVNKGFATRSSRRAAQHAQLPKMGEPEQRLRFLQWRDLAAVTRAAAPAMICSSLKSTGGDLSHFFIILLLTRALILFY